MSATSDDLCMENLVEWILDENRVITAKGLSRDLNMHINVAKQKLDQFVKVQSGNLVELEVVLLLASLDLAGKRRVSLVRQSELEEEHSDAVKVTSKHIYAVGRKEALAGTNAEQVLTKSLLETVSQHPHLNTLSSITNESCVRQYEQQKAEEEVSVDSQQNGLDHHVRDGDKAKVSNHKEAAVKNGKQKNKPIVGIFAKQAQKRANTTNDVDLVSVKRKNDNEVENGKSTESLENSKTAKGKSSKHSVPKQKNGAIASMFAKQAAKPNVNLISANKRRDPDLHDDTAVSNNDCGAQISPIASPTEENLVNEARENTQKAMREKQRPNILPRQRQKYRPQRKKIRMMSDSESEDGMDQEPDQDEEKEDRLKSLPQKLASACLSDDEDGIVPPTPENKEKVMDVSKKRKRVRKLVEKTYTDEQGFMVTKKEFESASDTDDDKIHHQVADKGNLKKAAEEENIGKTDKDSTTNLQKPKQAKIMDFFKKS